LALFLPLQAISPVYSPPNQGENSGPGSFRYPTNLPESSVSDRKHLIIRVTWLYNSFQKGESTQMSGNENKIGLYYVDEYPAKISDVVFFSFFSISPQ